MKKIFLVLSLMFCVQSVNAMTGWVAAKLAAQSLLLYGLVKGVHGFYKEAKSMDPVIKKVLKKSEDYKSFRTHFGFCYGIKGSEIVMHIGVRQMFENAIIEGLNADLPLDKRTKNPFSKTEADVKAYQAVTVLGLYLCAGLSCFSAYKLGSMITSLIK